MSSKLAHFSCFGCCVKGRRALPTLRFRMFRFFFRVICYWQEWCWAKSFIWPSSVPPSRRDKGCCIEFGNGFLISFRCIILFISVVTVCFFPATAVCGFVSWWVLSNSFVFVSFLKFCKEFCYQRGTSV